MHDTAGDVADGGAVRRHIVVVVYYYPPAPSIGAQRWSSMAHHLRAMGHDVTVVTSALHGSLPDDGNRVVRATDLARAETLRCLLRRPHLPGEDGAPPQTPAPALLTEVVVPDSHLVSWVPSALLAVRRILARRRVDCVITSGPPDSVHLLPLMLGRRRPAWIADFRDGWRFEPLRERPWPTRVQDHLDARLERAVAGAADVVVGATSPIADDFRDRLDAKAHWVSNGFDPEAALPGNPPAIDPGSGIALVHTGTLAGPRGRDPVPLLDAVRRHNASAGEPAAKIRVVLAGRPSVEDERLLASAGEDVTHVGLLNRADTLALQREASALLLLTGTHRSEATGKVFEYLAAGRPILALADGNEAARIVRETGTGCVVPANDAATLDAALAALADGTLESNYAPRDLERFRYPGPAEAMAELVERALASRAARSR